MSVPFPTVVVKVGGSLFDHPALGPGLRKWLNEQSRRAHHLFVPGGGALADLIRNYHRLHGASEDNCHWMAIQTMAINARLLRSFIPDCVEVDHPSNLSGVLNGFHFCLNDQCTQGALPHDWRVTSDSIAARACELTATRSLVLLKSTDLPEGIEWEEAAKRGLVDAMFPEIVRRAELSVDWINFRTSLNGFC